MPRYESTPGGWAAANTIPQGPEAIRTLTDVLAPNPQDGDGLVWVDRDKKWEPVALGPSATVVLSTDSFNRANSATNLGSTDGAGSLDPLVWVQARGTWGITSNQAYPPAAPVGPPHLRAGAYVALGLADVDLTLTVAHRDATTGILFRYVDNDNYWAFFNDDANNCQLAKVVAGTSTLMGSNHVGGADPVVLRVVTAGSSISIYRDGVFLETLVNATFQTATNHGMISDSVNGRFDTWSASGAGTSAAPFVPIAGGTMTGPLILSGNPVVPLGAAPKQYVDTRPPFPPWTVGTNGDVTATVDDPTKIPIEIVGLSNQSVPLLDLIADTVIGSTDIVRVRQSVAQGGRDIFTVDDSGEVDISMVDPQGDGLHIQDLADGTGSVLAVTGSMANRNQLAAFFTHDIGGVVGVGTQTLFDGGLRFYLNGVGDVLAFDPVAGKTTFTAHPGQTEPLVKFIDESSNDVGRVMPDGLIVSKAQTLPAVGDLAVGDHGSVSNPTAKTITRFLKDSASVLRTETVALGVPDYTQSFLLAGV